MIMESICGVDCTKCELNTTCKGCSERDGQPFGEECIVALYCKKGSDRCYGIAAKINHLKQESEKNEMLIKEKC